MRNGSISSPSSRLRSLEDARGSTASPDPKRRLLRLEERLPLAVTSPRVPTLEDRLPLLPPVANQRHLRKTQRGAARAITELFRQDPAAQRGHRRLPVGQDHRGWWRTEGLRRGQEGAR